MFARRNWARTCVAAAVAGSGLVDPCCCWDFLAAMRPVVDAGCGAAVVGVGGVAAALAGCC